MARTYGGKTAAAVCRRAGQIGRQAGWCRGTWQNDDGEMCLVALLNRALGRPNIKDELPKGIRLAVHQHLLATHESYWRHMIELKGHADPFKAPSNADLFTWNDAPGRTAQDVIGALEAIGTTPDRDWDGWLQVLTVNDDASVEVRELVSV